MRDGHRRARGPRRLSEVLHPTLSRLASDDQVRAYDAWTRGAGRQVAAATHVRAFARGRLTVECSSSVWASELTYLGGQILRRMDEVAPGHPVRSFRFVVAPVDGVVGPDSVATRSSVDEGSEQEDRGVATKNDGRRQRLAPADLDRARAQAEGVRDDRLRAAIRAALRDASEEPPAAPDRGTPSR